MKHTTRRLVLPALLALLLAALPAARPARAATFDVTSTADNGLPGSLRYAIDQAKTNPGADTITFTGIPNSSVITLVTPLVLDGGDLTIDGTRGTGRPQIVITASSGQNRGYGLLITSANNQVKGLIINGYGGSDDASGLVLSGNGAQNNTIENNYIGTDYDGQIAVSNGYGLAIQSGASNNTVQDNLISGNLRANVFIGPTTSTTNFPGTPFSGRFQNNNRVQRNRIGTNAAGDSRLFNGTQNGVFIFNNSNNNIVGPDNIISGNGTSANDAYGGVWIAGSDLASTVPSPPAAPSGNQVVDNRIGTNDAGTVAIPNVSNGVFIGSSSGTVVGGSSANRNIISGNTGPGVQVRDTFLTGRSMSAITISYNYIGVNAAGTAALGNTGVRGNGVFIWDESTGVTVGPGNLIGGNALYGVYLFGVPSSGAPPARQTEANTVTGNLIGTNAAGDAAIGNQVYGVLLRGGTAGNTIDSNRITGNRNNGVVFDYDKANGSVLVPTGNILSNNTIGVLSNNQAIGNVSGTPGNDGIVIYAGTGNTVGPGNTIAGHARAGVAIDGNLTTTGLPLPSGNTVKGNLLGRSGAISAGNARGVMLTNSASNNTVGGAGPGACAADPGGDCNLIAGNQIGVLIDSLSSNNQVLGNRAQNNSEVGIDVSDIGTVGNRILRTTTSTNGSGGIRLSFGGNGGGPASINPTPTASGNTVSGTVNCPSGPCTVQVFGSSSALTNEGPAYLGEQTGIAAGAASSFSVNLSPCALFLIFTATDGSGNTSPFQQPVANPSCQPPTPAQAQVTGPTPSANQSAPAGQSVTYRYTIRNIGQATGQFALEVVSTTSGWNAAVAPAGAVGLAANQTADFDVTVTVPGGATPPASGTTVVAPVVEGVRGANQPPLTTSVAAGPTPLLQLQTGETAAKSGNPGATVTYNLALRNTGSTGNFTLALSPSTPVPGGWSTNIASLGPYNITGGGTQNIAFQVTIAGGAQVGPAVPLTVVASAGTGPALPSSLTTNTSVNLVPVAPALTRTSPASQNAGPGQPVDFAFTLAHTANGADSFDLSFPGGQTQLPAGWTVTVLPGATVSNLAPNTTANLTLRVTPPTSPAPTPGSYTFTAQACSKTDTSKCSANVPGTVQIVPAAVPRFDTIAPVNIKPGAQVTLNHMLSNVGNTNGSFNLSAVLPSGLSLVTLTPASTGMINPGDNTPVALTIQAAGSAKAGAYTVVLRATAADANAATASASDTVNVDKDPALALTPPSQSDNLAPNTVYTRTLTLRNNGNFTDTIQLAAGVSRPGWRARVVPGSANLIPGASTSIDVGITVPPGQPVGIVNTTTVTATYSSLPVGTAGRQVQATLTTNIIAAPGLLLGPAVQSRFGKATEAVAYTFVLTNSGSIPQSYALTLGSPPASPPGWQATLLTSSPVGPLQPGGTAQVQVRLRAPEGTPEAVPFDVTLTAQSDQAPNPQASAKARLTIGAAFGVIISPNNQSQAPPGAVVRYTHIVRNIGFSSDTIQLRAQSLLNYETLPVAPPSVQLGPGESQTIEVTVLIPTSAAAGDLDTVVVTAQSTGNPDLPPALATNVTTVRQVPGISLAPSRGALLVPGARLVFDHQVTNIGNGIDSYQISFTQDLSWTITLVVTQTPGLARGGSYPVQVRVTVPTAAAGLASNRIRITARSTTDPSVTGQVVDTISPIIIGNRPRFDTYLPVVRGQ